MAAIEILSDINSPGFCVPREKTCCFSGHRSLPIVCYEEIKGNLLREVEWLIERGYRHFITGGALGFDTLAARVVLLMKQRFPDISLTVAIPCRGQADAWSEANRERYRKIIENADRALLLSEEYSRGCMQRRNRFMVDNSSVCIAFLNSEHGGTAQTVAYARKNEVSVINVAAK